jgi:hypothetical protein
MYSTNQKMHYSVDEALDFFEKSKFIEHQRKYTVFKIKDSV